jgi:energy-coupling factor transporter transmembrane protein EcfT
LSETLQPNSSPEQSVLRLHPASRILIYVLAALAIPGLPLHFLPFPGLLALVLLLLARQAPLRLVWRTRWLLMVLLFGYAYSIPGESIWPVLGSAAPSLEGLLQGLKQSARLLVLLLWLDLLVLRLSSESLLAGLYQLLRPLDRLGAHPDRIALRLGLTLRAIEGLDRGRGHLRALLTEGSTPNLPDRLILTLQPIRTFDGLVLSACFALTLLIHLAGS